MPLLAVKAEEAAETADACTTAHSVGAADLAAAQALSPLFGRLRAAGCGATDDAPAAQEQLPEPPKLNILNRYAVK
jgi:hypothetical protein